MNHLVYIAGPYTNPDPVVNTRTAVAMGLNIHDATGVGVIVPHLSLLAHAMYPNSVDYWYKFDLAQLANCTALYRIAGDSIGADDEEKYALNRGIPIFKDTRKLYRFVRS